ncbi:unnamed protein product, partial [Amoebophrya sp. A25]|eukprot:GSA25T00001603001.1
MPRGDLREACVPPYINQNLQYGKHYHYQGSSRDRYINQNLQYNGSRRYHHHQESTRPRDDRDNRRSQYGMGLGQPHGTDYQSNPNEDEYYNDHVVDVMFLNSDGNMMRSEAEAGVVDVMFLNSEQEGKNYYDVSTSIESRRGSSGGGRAGPQHGLHPNIIAHSAQTTRRRSCSKVQTMNHDACSYDRRQNEQHDPYAYFLNSCQSPPPSLQLGLSPQSPPPSLQQLHEGSLGSGNYTSSKGKGGKENCIGVVWSPRISDRACCMDQELGPSWSYRSSSRQQQQQQSFHLNNRTPTPSRVAHDQQGKGSSSWGSGSVSPCSSSSSIEQVRGPAVDVEDDASIISCTGPGTTQPQDRSSSRERLEVIRSSSKSTTSSKNIQVGGTHSHTSSASGRGGGKNKSSSFGLVGGNTTPRGKNKWSTSPDHYMETSSEDARRIAASCNFHAATNHLQEFIYNYVDRQEHQQSDAAVAQQHKVLQVHAQVQQEDPGSASVGPPILGACVASVQRINTNIIGTTSTAGARGHQQHQHQALTYSTSSPACIPNQHNVDHQVYRAFLSTPAPELLASSSPAMSSRGVPVVVTKGGGQGQEHLHQEGQHLAHRDPYPQPQLDASSRSSPLPTSQELQSDANMILARTNELNHQMTRALRTSTPPQRTTSMTGGGGRGNFPVAWRSICSSPGLLERSSTSPVTFALNSPSNTNYHEELTTAGATATSSTTSKQSTSANTLSSMSNTATRTAATATATTTTMMLCRSTSALTPTTGAIAALMETSSIPTM